MERAIYSALVRGGPKAVAVTTAS
ncbi:MAG: hypothetical protein RLZZ454_1679, partial [Pseudomonadota bacterium]